MTKEQLENSDWDDLVTRLSGVPEDDWRSMLHIAQLSPSELEETVEDLNAVLELRDELLNRDMREYEEEYCGKLKYYLEKYEEDFKKLWSKVNEERNHLRLEGLPAQDISKTLIWEKTFFQDNESLEEVIKDQSQTSVVADLLWVTSDDDKDLLSDWQRIENVSAVQK